MKSDFAAYVFFVNRADLLQRSINAFPDVHGDLTVVNNSGRAYFNSQVDTFTPPVPLTYAQSMNWMLSDAMNRGRDFILHFHSDAMNTNPSAVRELLDYARKVKEEGKRWACLWTFYDILWAINPMALYDIGGCDTVFSSYFTDQDLKRRWLLSGWETIDTHIEGVSHEGSATIRSDEKLHFLNDNVIFPNLARNYRAKWGGDPGKETFRIPYNSQIFKDDK